jgi:sterol desaturase/sphingolipid hydroxylase (fatty acid hydroxylase superfamily)
MSLFTLEHSKLASQLDLAFFGAAAVGLGVLLILMGPRAGAIESIACAALGLASWTLIEYALHRFVLHGVKPFSTWHAEHHRRPAARIYSPTFVGVILIAVLIYVPAWMVWGPWPACAFTFGIVTGDFGYGITHHAIHHWGAERGWISRRKRWHGRHHAHLPAADGRPGYYGVTTPFWDYVFRTASGRPIGSRESRPLGPRVRRAGPLT